jgi:hypothetical protein
VQPSPKPWIKPDRMIASIPICSEKPVICHSESAVSRQRTGRRTVDACRWLGMVGTGMHVLVTGASGLIGSAVVAGLIAAGHDVVAVARNTAIAVRSVPAAQWVAGRFSVHYDGCRGAAAHGDGSRRRGRVSAYGRLDPALDRALPHHWSILVAGCLDVDADARPRRCSGGDPRAPVEVLLLPLFRIWFAFGFPAFGAVPAIFWLMITRPAIALLPFG